MPQIPAQFLFQRNLDGATSEKVKGVVCRALEQIHKGCVSLDCLFHVLRYTPKSTLDVSRLMAAVDKWKDYVKHHRHSASEQAAAHIQRVWRGFL